MQLLLGEDGVKSDNTDNILTFDFDTTTRSELLYKCSNMKDGLESIKKFVGYKKNPTYKPDTHNALNNLINSLKNFNKYLVQFIHFYDNQNAISAIGTLEFLDQISKYNTTETICFLDANEKNNNYFEIYKSDKYLVDV
jgi:hypothetical protein